MTWRDRARPIIDGVLRATRGQSESEIKAALMAAYPFGPRRYHPYRIWCDEVRVQRGRKRPPTHRPEHVRRIEAEAAGQLPLLVAP